MTTTTPSSTVVSTPTLDEAKRLLAEAGYEDGFSTTVTVPSNYIFHVDTAVILAEQLKAVGIDLEILQVDWATWLEQVYVGRDFDSTVIALTSEFTPKDVLARYDTESSGNFINFTNDEYDTVFATVQASVDMEERITGYHRLQEILVEEGRVRVPSGSGHHGGREQTHRRL